MLRASLLHLSSSILGFSCPPRGHRVLASRRNATSLASPHRQVLRHRARLVTVTRPGITAPVRHSLSPARRRARVAGQSMSPGLAAMNYSPRRQPVRRAARLLEEIGAPLTASVSSAPPSQRTAVAKPRASGPADRRPQAGPAAALAAPGQALRRHRRHRRPHDRQGTAGRHGKARTAGPHPRGQARRLLHPGQARLRRLPVRDLASTSVIATFEPAASFGGPGQGRRHPPRRGPRPPAHHPRRRRRLDLGIATAKFPGPPNRRPVPRPRAPARPRPALSVMLLDRKTNGSPPAWKTSTTATSTASTPPSAIPPRRRQERRDRHRPRLLREQRPPHALPLVPPVRPVHRLRVVEASCKTIIGQRLKQQACTGPSTAPTPSSPSAAKRPAAPGRASATPAHSDAHRLTRRSPKMISTTYKNDAHPQKVAIPEMSDPVRMMVA